VLALRIGDLLDSLPDQRGDLAVVALDAAWGLPWVRRSPGWLPTRAGWILALNRLLCCASLWVPLALVAAPLAAGAIGALLNLMVPRSPEPGLAAARND